MGSSSRRAMMTIYSDSSCPFSHQTRLVIAEKQIDANIESLKEDKWPEEVSAANPYGYGPTLFDRDLVLFDTRVINDYLDERFPHPPLMPVDPVARAKARLMLLRIHQDWYAHWSALSGREKSRANKARKMLQEDLTVLAPLFSEHNFFMSDEFSLLDCALAPLLWRLPQLNIKLPAQAKPVIAYAERLFSRESFQNSLSDIEKGMR